MKNLGDAVGIGMALWSSRCKEVYEAVGQYSSSTFYYHVKFATDLKYKGSTAQHSTADRTTAQHSTAQHSTAQHSTVLSLSY